MTIEKKRPPAPGTRTAAPPPPPVPPDRHADEAVDEALLETFPASDPPAWWAGPPD